MALSIYCKLKQCIPLLEINSETNFGFNLSGSGLVNVLLCIFLQHSEGYTLIKCISQQKRKVFIKKIKILFTTKSEAGVIHKKFGCCPIFFSKSSMVQRYAEECDLWCSPVQCVSFPFVSPNTQSQRKNTSLWPSES